MNTRISMLWWLYPAPDRLGGRAGGTPGYGERALGDREGRRRLAAAATEEAQGQPEHDILPPSGQTRRGEGGRVDGGATGQSRGRVHGESPTVERAAAAAAAHGRGQLGGEAAAWGESGPRAGAV